MKIDTDISNLRVVKLSRSNLAADLGLYGNKMKEAFNTLFMSGSGGSRKQSVPSIVPLTMHIWKGFQYNGRI